jgi:hypothetical protein
VNARPTTLPTDDSATLPSMTPLADLPDPKSRADHEGYQDDARPAWMTWRPPADLVYPRPTKEQIATLKMDDKELRRRGLKCWVYIDRPKIVVEYGPAMTLQVRSLVVTTDTLDPSWWHEQLQGAAYTVTHYPDGTDTPERLQAAQVITRAEATDTGPPRSRPVVAVRLGTEVLGVTLTAEEMKGPTNRPVPVYEAIPADVGDMVERMLRYVAAHGTVKQRDRLVALLRGEK